MRNGADVNRKNPIDGQSVLFTAVAGGREKMSELLIKAGANVNSVDNDKNTPLHLAVMTGSKPYTFCNWGSQTVQTFGIPTL